MAHRDAGYDSKFASLYWPWVKVFDPISGSEEFVPPSGHMAGVWARNDDTRGVHKAPANEVVRGVIALPPRSPGPSRTCSTRWASTASAAFPGRGVRVWGARTLASDAEWRYLNVRRLFNYVEESILLGTQWVVFEPNDPELWARIRRTISAFLVEQWRKGALFGATPDEAFFVKCDEETNPAEGIDAGQVVSRSAWRRSSPPSSSSSSCRSSPAAPASYPKSPEGDSTWHSQTHSTRARPTASSSPSTGSRSRRSTR